FYNVCAHRGTRLLDEAPACGHLGKAIKCPYHAWSYDLDGRLIGTPNVHEDEVFERSDYPLHAIAVADYAGFLFVSLNPAAPALSDWLRAGVERITDFDRYRLGELRVARRLVYEVSANWKILGENYNECLHCPTIHPELVQAVPLYRRGEVWDGETPDGGNVMREGATSFTISGQSNLPPLPGLREHDYSMYYGTFQFPNLLVNLHPDAVMTYRLEPHGPDRTTVISEFLFRPETIAESGFDPDPVVEFWDLISRQDWAVTERAQRGVASRSYLSGVYPRNDRLVFDFNERWRLAMGQPLLG
ncbi:MAG: aromatic ring-hydroxylating dioxygenase subunit alpha, partial [Dehalococcoidia bacterium]